MQCPQAFKYELMSNGEQLRQMVRFAYNKALAFQKDAMRVATRNSAMPGMRLCILCGKR